MVSVFVADGVHNLAYQVNAKTTDLSLLSREGYIQFLFLGWVEGPACIADDDSQTVPVGFHSDIDMSNRFLWVGIVHDVDNGLLNG